MRAALVSGRALSRPPLVIGVLCVQAILSAARQAREDLLTARSFCLACSTARRSMGAAADPPRSPLQPYCLLRARGRSRKPSETVLLHPQANMGVVGLRLWGTRDLHAARQPDATLRNDRSRERIARDPALISVSGSECAKGDVDVVPRGCMRLTVARARIYSYDYLQIDAFSADNTIPTHLPDDAGA